MIIGNRGLFSRMSSTANHISKPQFGRTIVPRVLHATNYLCGWGGVLEYHCLRVAGPEMVINLYNVYNIII